MPFARLNDPHLREPFIERIFAYQRWNEMTADPSVADLIQFHTEHKLTLMAHSPSGQRDLGRLVAEAGIRPLDEILEEYGRQLMEIMSRVVKRRRHTNVLQHVMGFVKDHVDTGDRQELVEVIDTYHRGLVPLIVPITLLRHHIRRHPTHPWPDSQVYLDPYPEELMLRNHV